MIETDPTSVSMKDFLSVVEKHEELANEAIKKGYDTREGCQSARRMDEKGVGKGGDQTPSATSGVTLPPGMGAGV